jgi:hypothetical protein
LKSQQLVAHQVQIGEGAGGKQPVGVSGIGRERLKQGPGQSACVDEPIIENAPDGHGAIAIAVKMAHWKRQAFMLLV